MLSGSHTQPDMQEGILHTPPNYLVPCLMPMPPTVLVPSSLLLPACLYSCILHFSGFGWEWHFACYFQYQNALLPHFPGWWVGGGFCPFPATAHGWSGSGETGGTGQCG